NAMNAFVEGRTSAPPILYCGHRARLLMSILSHAHIRSRLVNLLAAWPTAKDLDGHVMIEALNPATNRWEIADGDFDLYYSDGKQRLSLKDIVALPVERFQPCRGTRCGWNLPSSGGWFDVMLLVKRKMYAAGLVHPGQNNIPADGQTAHIISNRAR